MSRSPIPESALDALAAEFDDSDAPPPEPLHRRYANWKPRVNVGAQERVYASIAKFILAYGERGSGKTIGALHKLVDHCVNNQNALALVIVGVKRQAEEGGAWFKLINSILPEWETGLGLDHDKDPFFTDAKTNTAKDVFIWVRNKYDGWSRIVLLSMPVEGFVADRIKGMEPSFILVDEAQTLGSDVYFKSIVQQVGRRPHIKGSQQVIYCANPDGPSHWLYKRFWELCLNEETGEMNPDYARFHVPIEENVQNLPRGYYDTIREAVKGDPIEEARMLRGEWIDRPSGEAIFKEFFIPAIHVVGILKKGTGLRPRAGFPIFVGYDLGQVYSSITFEQPILTEDKLIWIVFDEIAHLKEKILYKKLAKEVTGRMDFWTSKVGYPFKYHHVSDESAINQWRPGGEGSYDAWDMERFSEGRIKMTGCPKGKGSVEARIHLIWSKLNQEELFISAQCEHHIGMLNGLESEPGEGTKPKRSKWIHIFDSLTYPIFKYEVKGMGRRPESEKSKPQVYSCGQN